jgi:transcription antitermination factor NusG
MSMVYSAQEPQISFDGAKWFCVVVQPNAMRRAEYHLGAAGYRTFCPKLRKWVSHARVKKAVERPLLSRYLFVEVDYPRQSFADVRSAYGVESIVSQLGIPAVIPADKVEELLQRYMAGEFDQVANAAIPIGARVMILEGEFDNLLATVTGFGKGGRATVKLLDRNRYVSKLSAVSMAPA